MRTGYYTIKASFLLRCLQISQSDVAPDISRKRVRHREPMKKCDSFQLQKYRNSDLCCREKNWIDEIWKCKFSNYRKFVFWIIKISVCGHSLIYEDTLYGWHQLRVGPNFEQICVQLPTSAVSVTLLAVVAERRAICCYEPCSVDRYLPPSRRSAANPLQPRAVGEWWDGQTDGETDAWPFHRLCCAYYVSSGSECVHNKAVYT